MVSPLKTRGPLFLLIAFQVLLSSCSLGNPWGGETKEPPAIQAGETGSSCPPWETFLSDQEEVSVTTFQCWKNQIGKIWTEVEGKTTDALSEAEIATLIRKQIVRIPGDPEKAIQRVIRIKRLLGIRQDLTRREVNQWIDWVETKRAFMRNLYQKFRQPHRTLTFTEIQQTAELVSSALRRINWAMSSNEFARSIITVFDIQDPDLLRAMEPGSEVVINTLNMLCPTFYTPEIWQTQSIAYCVDLMIEKFKIGAPWFDFLMNPTQRIPTQQIEEIDQSLNALSIEVQNWFQSPKLSPIYPTRWVELSRKIRANPPVDFLNSLRVIRRFKHRSNEEAIYPEEMIRIFEIIRRAQKTIFEGLPLFYETIQKAQCQNPGAKDWTHCILSDSVAEEEWIPAVKIAWRIKNFHHGQSSSPLNGEAFSRISFFYEIAGQVIELFHNECPSKALPWKECNPNLITTDVGDANDHLVQLITIGVNTAETIDRLISNIRRKFDHQPFEEEPSLIDRHWNIAGLARLIATTSDLLVKRTKEESDLLSRWISKMILPNKSSLSLDQLAITAIFETIDSLPRYRQSYLSLLEETQQKEKTQKIQVNRGEIMKALPALLNFTFPRTFESCSSFGFQNSCKIVFDHVIPIAQKNNEWIEAHDLDILTIVASSIEGLMDSCDQNGDSKLHWGLLSNQDELDCGYERAQEILKRLMESRIVDMTEGDQEKSKLLLWLINATPITRTNGKIALSRGTSEYLMANLLWAPFYFTPYATLGSTYSLIADLVDPQSTRSKRDRP